MPDEIDDLIKELQNDQVGQPKTAKPSPFELTPETIEKFVLEKANRIVTSGLNSIEEIEDALKQGINPEEILAYSDLLKSTTGALETLNKIYLQNKKIEATREFKTMDAQKKLPGNTTNVLITTREDVMKRLLTEINDVSIPKEIIDIEIEEKD
jgi:hypothetical protein